MILTNQKQKYQDNKETTSKKVQQAIISKIAGTICIAASGLLLHLDVVFSYFNIELSDIHGWPDQDTFLHYLGQTLAPMFIILGFYLRTYYLALLIPIYLFCLQLLFTIDGSMASDAVLSKLYASGYSAIAIALAFLIKYKLKQLDKKRNEKIAIMQELINLDQKQ